MSVVYDILKSQALRWLPESWLGVLKARRYSRMLESFNVDDEPDLKLLPMLVLPGSTAVDVGANIGVYTKRLSELVGPSGTVISIEPVPATFAILRANVRNIGLSNVTLVQAAASDAESTVTMIVPEYESGGNNYYESHIVANGAATPHDRSVTVATNTLDAIVGRRQNVSFVKCDVEGHENAALAGAVLLLREHRPAWLIEISNDPDVPSGRSAALFALLASHGYEPWMFDGTQAHPRRRGDRSANYFFLRPEHVAQLRSGSSFITDT